MEEAERAMRTVDSPARVAFFTVAGASAGGGCGPNGLWLSRPVETPALVLVHDLVGCCAAAAVKKAVLERFRVGSREASRLPLPDSALPTVRALWPGRDATLMRHAVVDLYALCMWVAFSSAKTAGE